MSKKWYSMRVANKTAELDIYTDIGFWGITAQDFRKELKSHGKLDHIDLSINSYGGEVYDGFAIYNDLKETGASITVTVKGIAASIASYIAMAGTKIKIHKNAMIMIHNPAVCMCGESKDLRKEADVLDNMKDSAIKAYKEHAKNLSDTEIIKLMDETTYMTADRAVELGFADEVLEAIQVEEPETNMGFSIPINYRKSIFTNKIPAGNLPAKEVTMKCPKCGKHDILEGQTMCIECARAQERAEAVASEQNRIVAINDLCSVSGLSTEFTNGLIKSGKPIDQITGEITKEIQRMKALPPVPPAAPPLHVDKDEADKFRMHAVNCLAVQSGIEKDPAVIADVRKGVQINGLHGLMRRDLQRHGIDSIGMSIREVVDSVFKMAGTGSSDLPAILGDITNKNLGKAYAEAPTTFQGWTGTIEVPDFKAQKLIKMSNFSDIDNLPEGMPFKNKKLTDKYESVSVDTKGNIFTITRKALINDDLNAITRVPAAMAGAMKRRINTDVYDLLTSASLVGPTMTEDSVALFDATAHKNLKASSGVISVASLAYADQMLLEMPLPKAERTDKQQYANVTGKFLITGTSQRLTALQVLRSTTDPATTKNGNVYNPYENGLVLIVDAYLQALLTAGSAGNAFYVATDPSVMGHIVVAYLQGQTTPSIRSEMSGIGDAQGFTTEIYFDAGVGVEDYRGITYNDGK